MSEQRPAQTIATQTQRTAPETRASDYKTFYTGSFRFRLTNVDASITFMSLADLPGGVSALQDEATAFFNFASLKTLSEHLAAAVSTIEQALGPIRIPANVRPTEEGQAQILRTIQANPLTE